MCSWRLCVLARDYLFRLPRPRMCLVEYLCQEQKDELGIDLRGTDIRVHNQLLDVAQVAPGFLQVAGKGKEQVKRVHIPGYDLQKR